MSDDQRQPPTNEPTDDQRPTTDRPIYESVKEAARRLGISENAVRLRIKRGTLPAEKIGEQWFLVVGDRPPASTATTSQMVGGQRPPTTNDASVGDQQLVVMLEEAIERTGSKYVADITALYDRIEASYRETLDAKNQTIAALERERDELRARLEVAESPRSVEGERNVESPVRAEDDAPGRNMRSWWRFWER